MDAHWQIAQIDAAIAHFRRVIEQAPRDADAHNNLGTALAAKGEVSEAEQSYRRAIELQPELVGPHNNLGEVFRKTGRLDEATTCYRRAIEFDPECAAAHNNLGIVLHVQGKYAEAAASYRRCLELNPHVAEVYSNLANVLRDDGDLDGATDSLQQALKLKPDSAAIWTNCGNVLKDAGRWEETLDAFRRATELDPSPVMHSSLVYMQTFCPGFDAQTLQEELKQWNERHAQPLVRLCRPHENNRDPSRRLRIGYVSADFRDHVVGRNVLPLLEHHDHGNFHVTLYFNANNGDDLTTRFQQAADQWRSIFGQSDESVAEQIRQDQIDILVDLSLHMAGSRLPVFARKPAPVQVTFAGYPGSTGLDTIDYRLSDPYLDPPGVDESVYPESTYRLPHSFWCYDPQSNEPAVSPLPALQKGLITFGCLNNFCKVNHDVLDLWARVLHRSPRSKLLLLAKEGSYRRRSLDFFLGRGIAAERILFQPLLKRQDYLALYHNIDVGLDTLPYNGHTTSLDSYWMGVPVVTLVGKTVVGRAGLSQLTNLCLTELAATSAEEYVRLAVGLAADLPRLQTLRSTLRDRMRQSPLMDSAGFTRGIEATYRTMWRTWCNSSL